MSSDPMEGIDFETEASLCLPVDVPNWFAWNGSKRWLLESLAGVMSELNVWGDYYEPFIGGGCVSSLVRSIYPTTAQRVSDANPWLISAYQSQLLAKRSVVPDFINVERWRGMTDAELPNLSVNERANRFAISLLTAWGNRWKTKPDGSMGNENPVNKDYIKPEYLKKKLDAFFAVKWLREGDTATRSDWLAALGSVKAGDMVFIDPPYPESLGYGNQWWSFSNQLDVIDWVADAVKLGVNVVVSNMDSLERLYRRAGLSTRIITGPKKSKTRAARSEVLAWFASRNEPEPI